MTRYDPARPQTGPAELGHLMAEEVAEQPDALTRQLEHGMPDITALATHIRAVSPRFVLLAARGTSDHAALYAKYLIEIALGLPVGMVSTSQAPAPRELPPPRSASVYAGQQVSR